MTQHHPALTYDDALRAGRRSRAGGPWSLEYLRPCWLVLLPVGVVLTVIAAWAAGSRAAAGAAVGTAIVGVFFTLSTLIVAKVGQRAPKMVLAAALATYIVKIVALGVVIVVLPKDGPIAPRWMAIAVVIGLVTWMTAHLRYIWTAKVYYTDPS